MKSKERVEAIRENGSSGAELLQPPPGLSPLEQALWTLAVFSKQVAAFTDDAARMLHVAAANQSEQPALPKLTRRRRGAKRLRGGYRQAG